MKETLDLQTQIGKLLPYKPYIGESIVNRQAKILVTATLAIIALISVGYITSLLVKDDNIIFEKIAPRTPNNLPHNSTKQAILAFQKGCNKINKNRSPIFADNKEIWQNICEEAQNNDRIFQDKFNLYRIHTATKSTGLFTGYYEISLNGSRTKQGDYKYPIYRTPSDEKDLNLTRKEISDGALNGKNLEILYVNDLAKLFFLHIQGSGVVKLQDGKEIFIGFDKKNKHKYHSIGKYFLEKKIFTRENISALAIMDWLRNNPDKADEITNLNPSYIFFRERNARATGSLGIELTAEGSIAVDRNIIPLGLPLFLRTILPDNNKFSKILIAQDTGSAIKGVIRGDIFFGSGNYAENIASGMKNPGKLYMLIPKDINPNDYF